MHVPNLMPVNSLFFIKPRLTNNVQNVLHLHQRMQVHVYHGLSQQFKGTGAVLKGLTGIKKLVCEVFLNFKFDLNT
jgi:hypothetical protein